MVSWFWITIPDDGLIPPLPASDPDSRNVFTLEFYLLSIQTVALPHKEEQDRHKSKVSRKAGPTFTVLSRKCPSSKMRYVFYFQEMFLYFLESIFYFPGNTSRDVIKFYGEVKIKQQVLGNLNRMQNCFTILLENN